ncbi:proteasome subunit beta [Streptomyces radicis]|uniref:Proteasome subunit beta n=1 Tax=Streptomyces radicis TaxID=1750517 RepID=A0A3A9WLN3_9ACTN|nr:proteasome subunit beta [Streptomyces radicis]RKN07067.1 proteasome subunit beta [Streptomyces radicis]RKN15127.1 proteasome subunit beta [Streptomyces radicis]
MSADAADRGQLPAGFLAPGPPSFLDFLARHAPDALPARPVATTPGADERAQRIPHGTTIVAATYADGVLIAGDRRITQGNLIAHRDAEKVLATDEFSAVGISGTVGIALDMVRLFQLELEHYEKVEGVPLSLVGKANRLTAMIRGNLGLAMQGLAVIPLFAGYDVAGERGRVFSFDVTGGHHEERDFATTGSGSPFARGALKKLYRPGMSADDICAVVVQALYDAADEDTATGGPDLARQYYPLLTLITEEGVRTLDFDESAAIARRVVDGRRDRPDGPTAAPL